MNIPGYTIQHRVGRGRVTTIYIATQESLDRLVALKTLDTKATIDKDKNLINRFLLEARMIAKLKHPNIITIHDIGTSNDILYICMEYANGGDLKSRLGIPITPSIALDYLSKIGAGLGTAHKAGIIHRDLKPENILFRNETSPLITDFGIAKWADTTGTSLTSSGIFLGSPNYASPEQIEGADIDGRTDIYSLGCIFYEMLSGNKPYVSQNIYDVFTKHQEAPIPVLEKALAEFQPLLNKMMAKNRNQRFNNVTAMQNTIIELQHDIDAY